MKKLRPRQAAKIPTGGNKITCVRRVFNSEEVATFDPIAHFLSHLPQWDGQNHVARLFSRLPGVSSEQLAYLSIWLRSAVAHWMQLDTLHGNTHPVTSPLYRGVSANMGGVLVLEAYKRKYHVCGMQMP